MATFEGATGRVVGTVWGGAWLTCGIGFGIVVAGTAGVLPPVLESAVADVAPGVIPAPGREGPSLGGLAMGGLSAAVAAVYGSYELGKALFRSDYSIALKGQH